MIIITHQQISIDIEVFSAFFYMTILFSKVKNFYKKLHSVKIKNEHERQQELPDL
jgi:hypothetical protein